MIWAVLGEIEFELTNHPSAQAERGTADYAEHAMLQGKPKLQWIGEGLDELTLELAFHAALVDPEVQLRKLKTAKAAHEPLPYVLGSGDYRGIYVITALDVTTRKTDGNGRLLSALANISLREYTGKYTKPLPRPQALRNSALATPLAQVTQVGGRALPSASLTQKALVAARTAGSMLRTGAQVFEQVKSLRDNPLALLGQAPQLLSLAGQALGPLQLLQTNAAGLLARGAELVQLGSNVGSDIRQVVETTLAMRDNPLALLNLSPQLLGAVEQLPVGQLRSTVSTLVADGAGLLQFGVAAADDVNQVRLALDPISLGTVVDQVDVATGRMQQALARADTAAPRLARMTADIITRRA
ncbi:phage tail protein [Pseudomonas leptonychotis]|uniref:phage tail protein n=1 Tax=Pseudomonas leptonychotis TaxID=2448482 RepID=UPI00386DD15F